ncbi:phage tail protein [Algoriphagus sediminis]|uniref:Tail fiber protein n=1 Tax=Algoriphagus sediminis TaxID=3057113 RepID=A0ABT7Y7K3_9BACT|nr:tail fiber protein [Algoriphagus sediminis]MDN3202503.1 tail fiber protein [Algoriphagus sediminis]
MEGTIGEIRLFGGNFPPRNWADCSGQLLPISQNTALFSILGTIYGGDGRTTFALPDLRGRVSIGEGNGPGLADFRLGSRAGAEQVQLNITNLPSHNHTMKVSSSAGDSSDPSGRYVAKAQTEVERGATPVPVDAYGNVANQTPMAANSVGNTGGGQPFSVKNPYLGLRYIICLFGIFPSRS